jgi:hypothetical protein
MSSHVVPLKIYVGVFLSLLFFTGLTTGVAFIDLGPFNTVVALAIATIKMLLVVLLHAYTIEFRAYAGGGGCWLLLAGAADRVHAVRRADPAVEPDSLRLGLRHYTVATSLKNSCISFTSN